MQVNTKFGVGDFVWWVWNRCHAPVCAQIVQLQILVYSGTAGHKVIYTLDVPWIEDQPVSEKSAENIFATREEAEETMKK